MTHLMVTLLPQIVSLLNVASAAFSAAPRVVNCTKAHPGAKNMMIYNEQVIKQTLLLDQGHIPDLSIRVECIPDISVSSGLLQTSNIQGGDHLVLGRVQVRHGLGSLEDLLRHRIIVAVVTILHVLV